MDKQKQVQRLLKEAWNTETKYWHIYDFIADQIITDQPLVN